MLKPSGTESSLFHLNVIIITQITRAAFLVRPERISVELSKSDKLFDSSKGQKPGLFSTKKNGSSIEGIN